MMRAFRLCLVGAALVVAAGSASAAELRLGEAELDRVIAGFDFPGAQSTSLGNSDFTPFPSTTFGGFDLFDGPLTPPPPTPPLVTPPIGGGAGNPIQSLLALLFGLANLP